MKIRRIDFYPSDWLEGTIELSSFDRGVYITICSLIYARGGPITEELITRSSIEHGNAILASLSRLEKARKIVRNGLEISQKRCGNELERCQKRSGNASENASKRWKNNGIEDEVAMQDGNAHARASTINSQHKDSPDGESPPVDPPPPDAKHGQAKRGTRLAVDWQPSEADRDFALANGLDPGAVAGHFRDYWTAIPGAKGCKLDWGATFRNWCRNERNQCAGFGGRSGSNGHRPASFTDAIFDILRDQTHH